MTSGSTEGMPKVLKQLFHNRGRLLMRSIWNSDHIFSIFFCCERQDDGTVEKGPNRVIIRMPLNCSINVAFSDAPIASISLVPLSLIVFPRVGSRNRCSRLKTLCKASLTLTSDITEIYRQARAIFEFGRSLYGNKLQNRILPCLVHVLTLIAPNARGANYARITNELEVEMSRLSLSKRRIPLSLGSAMGGRRSGEV